MKSLLSIVGFVVVVLAIARLIPVDPEPYHEDPAEPDHQRSEVRLIGRDAPRFSADADTVLATFANIARSELGVYPVAGSVDEGMMTFVARSRVFGFRDYITVKATDESGGAKLAIFARPRFNLYDWGVNAKRLDRWLSKLERALRR